MNEANQNTKRKLYGITIGPINDTLQLSSKPAALWAGSYLFSELSYLLCEQIKEAGHTIITPYYDPPGVTGKDGAASDTSETGEAGASDNLSANGDAAADDASTFSPAPGEDDKSWFPGHQDGIGLFPDHIIFAPDAVFADDANRWSKVRKWREEAIKKLAEKFTPKVNGSESLREYLLEYLQVHFFEFELPQNGDTSSTNPILASQNAFDCIELEYGFKVSEDKNQMLEMFEYDDGRRNNEAHKQSKSKMIKSLIGGLKRDDTSDNANNTNDNDKVITDRNELLAQDDASDRGPSYSLARTWPLWDDHADNQIRDLEDIAHDNKPLAQRLKKHRYYAIVRADGDSMGKTIASAGKQRSSNSNDASTATNSWDFGGIEEFSRICWNYSRQAAKEVKDYHGVTIYSGGDDLLAIVPIENNDGKTILDLVANLRKVFIEEFNELDDSVVKPTLSLGTCMYFYKYPLYEALSKSAELLFGRAKGVEGKDTLALYLEKHSGKQLDLLFKKQASSWEQDGLLNLLQNQIARQVNAPDQSSIRDFYNGSIQRLDSYEVLYAEAIKRSNDKMNLIRPVFENTFDDQVAVSHTKQNEHLEDMLKLLEALICEGKAAAAEVCPGTVDTCSEDPSECLFATNRCPECPGIEQIIIRRLKALMRFKKFFVERGDDE